MRLSDFTLWERMLKDIEIYWNKKSQNKEKFLKQKTISKTMHPPNTWLIEKYMKHGKSNDYCSKILPKIIDPDIGSPTVKEGYSLSTTQHAYYLTVLYENLKLEITDFDHITDVGGGYGNFYRIAKNLGYEKKFDIVDFPIIHEIQKYYITELELDLPDFIEIGDINPKGRSILFGFHSVNEMPMSDRELLEEKYSMYDNIMLLYNSHFDGIDNIEYFEKLKDQLSNTFNVEIIGNEMKGNASFLIASRKEI